MPVKNFNDIISSSKNLKKKVAVISPHNETNLEAIKMAMDEGIAEPVLIGDEKIIGGLIEKVIGKDKKIEVHNSPDDKSAVMLGCKLIKEGHASSIMKGHLSTSTFLKGILDKDGGLNTGRFLSHVVVLEIPTYHKLLFVTDGGMNPHPDLETKVNILNNAIDMLTSLGIENPKVACLAGVETVNENQPETLDAAVLVEMNKRGQISGAVVDGPLALDLAISAEAANIKGIESEVAGDADILLTPDMASANIMAKSLIHLANAKSAGIIVGASCPVILLSRADDAETKMRSIALGVSAGR